MRSPRTRGPALTAPLALLLTLGVGVVASAAPLGTAMADTGEAAPASQAVTLVTGDRVTVTDGSEVSIKPARREGGEATFDTFTADGDTFVVPSDAAQLVPGTLDRELFNVSRLIEYGYHDGIPVIIEYTDAKMVPMSPPPGMSDVEILPGGESTSATITSEGAWWRGVRDGGARTGTGEIDMTVDGPLAGVERVRLDGPALRRG